MELRQLRYFVTVAEEMNFIRAARLLLIAQPALSQQIRNLEEELGVELFDRQRRQIKLTAAGKSLLEDARKLLHGAEMIVRTTQRVQRGEVGHLVIGFTPAASWLLPAIMQIYQEKYPEVELLFEELLNDEQIQALQREQIDVAVALGSQKQEGLSEELISSTPYIIALPEHHHLATETIAQVLWKEMATEPFVMFPRRIQPYLYDKFVSRCQIAGFMPRVVKEAAQLETIMNLVAAGRGIAPVAASLQRMVQWNGVVFKALEEPSPSFEIFAVWRTEDYPPVLQNFVKLISNYY